MKKINYQHTKFITAFTLIELLVVITIITIMSASGVFYFFDFVKNQEINQKLYMIEDDINTLDKEIKDYKIFDYEIIFDTSDINNQNYSYLTYTNNFDTKKQSLQINNSTWSWVITSSPASWSWIIKIYKNNKLSFNKEIDRSIDFPFDFNENSSYKITWTQSWEILNNIIYKYLSEDNILPEKNNLLKLVSINTQEDKTWTSVNKLKITNIWWKKKFFDNWSEISTNNIYLFFENNWKESFIKIKK